MLKVKKQKHVNMNHKKGGVAILTPDKADFQGPKNITKEETFSIKNGPSRRGNSPQCECTEQQNLKTDGTKRNRTRRKHSRFTITGKTFQHYSQSRRP